MKILALVLVLVWSPLTHAFVTPDVLDQQGLMEYGDSWWIVKPVVTGQPCPECALRWLAPKSPSQLTLS